MRILILFMIILLAPLAWADSSQPKSSFKPSTDVKYYGSDKAKSIEHVNVSVDDTTEDEDAEVQERAEWKMTNTVTVLNNMGASSNSKIYSAEDLDSKTGKPVEKKGVVEVPKGETVRFTTAGSKIVEKKKKQDEEVKEAPRVLVS